MTQTEARSLAREIGERTGRIAVATQASRYHGQFAEAGEPWTVVCGNLVIQSREAARTMLPGAGL
jgi:hypothetical protein